MSLVKLITVFFFWGLKLLENKAEPKGTEKIHNCVFTSDYIKLKK